MVFNTIFQRLWNAPMMVKMGVGAVASQPFFLYRRKRNRVKDAVQYRKQITDTVYFDIAIGEKYAGRIIIGCYGQECPMTCENFIQLCKGFKIRDKVVGYRNTSFHCLKDNFASIGGDVLDQFGTSYGGWTIYGPTFPDENFDHDFTQVGDVAMCSFGPNCNTSQFMIMNQSNHAFNGLHVNFGQVLKGLRIVEEMKYMASKVGRPLKPIRVLDCGEFTEEKLREGIPEEFVRNQDRSLKEDDWMVEREKKRLARAKFLNVENNTNSLNSNSNSQNSESPQSYTNTNQPEGDLPPNPYNVPIVSKPARSTKIPFHHKFLDLSSWKENSFRDDMENDTLREMNTNLRDKPEGQGMSRMEWYQREVIEKDHRTSQIVKIGQPGGGGSVNSSETQSSLKTGPAGSGKDSERIPEAWEAGGSSGGGGTNEGPGEPQQKTWKDAKKELWSLKRFQQREERLHSF